MWQQRGLNIRRAQNLCKAVGMSPTVAVLLNSRAGARDAGAVRRVAAAFRGAGCDAAIEITDGKQITAAIAAALAGRVDGIVAGGGDGTVSAVASALVGTGVPMG